MADDVTRYLRPLLSYYVADTRLRLQAPAA
jgi:hypothetical protein